VNRERELELELAVATAKLRTAELELEQLRPLGTWRADVLERASRAGRPEGMGLCEWFTEAVACARSAARIGKVGFLLGWLDATWSGFGHAERVDMPEDIRRALVREGWLAPKSAPQEDGSRRASITPGGMQQVLSINKAYRIKRTIRLEDGSEREL